MCVEYVSREFKCENCSLTITVTSKAFSEVFEGVKTCNTCYSNTLIRAADDLGKRLSDAELEYLCEEIKAAAIRMNKE